MWRGLIKAECHDGARKTKRTRRPIKMAVIPLGRADQGKAMFIRASGKGTGQAIDFNRIAKRGAGAVGFDIGYGTQFDVRRLRGLPDDICLHGRVGGGRAA